MTELLAPRAYESARWIEKRSCQADELFELARRSAWFGAGPLGTTIPRLAPAFYGRRFAPGHTAIAYGPHAYGAAALLRDVSRRCDVAQLDEIAGRYFGVLALADDGPYDLAIGSGAVPPSAAGATVVQIHADASGAIPIVAPLPTDVLISFDPADGPVVGSFTIHRPAEPVIRGVGPGSAPPRGGSSDALRLCYARMPPSCPTPTSTRHARSAPRSLRKGSPVTFATRLSDVASFGADLIHLFGVRDGVYAAEVAGWAAVAGIPPAVHAYRKIRRPAATGEPVTRYCFASRPTTERERLPDVLANRAVEVDVTAAQRYAPRVGRARRSGNRPPRCSGGFRAVGS